MTFPHSNNIKHTKDDKSVVIVWSTVNMVCELSFLIANSKTAV